MVKHAVKLGWLLLGSLALWPLPSWSQPPSATAPMADKPAERDPRGPSADGNYWFEVEVTIFSSVYGGSRNSEVPVADANNLHYLGQLRHLQNQTDSYQFPFAGDLTLTAAAAATSISPTTANTAGAIPIGEGPLYSPADPNAFKILDHERDPFLALDRRYSRFSQLNSRLQSTDEHKVLWHQVWRQPLRARGQSPALQVEGGNMFGEHYQLEGSLRLSGVNDLPAIDANLWLSNAARDSIWQLNQSRELSANALYYLDHPTLGLLVEIRPYLVPETRVPASAPAKPVSKRGFE